MTAGDPVLKNESVMVGSQVGERRFDAGYRERVVRRDGTEVDVRLLRPRRP